MCAVEYIPTGRTSLVNDKGKPFQVQTEYAAHPYPRITTCVSHQGQVVHKVEKRLKRELSSEDEKCRAEKALAYQHGEVLAIIQKQSQADSAGSPGTFDCPSESVVALATDSKSIIEVDEPSQSAAPETTNETPTLKQLIHETVGVEHIFELDSHGNFRGVATEKQFRSEYKSLFKNLKDLLDVFALLPGSDFQRERGVYEIERDRLYLISAGPDCFFVTVRPIVRGTDFENSFRDLLGST